MALFIEWAFVGVVDGLVAAPAAAVAFAVFAVHAVFLFAFQADF